ncbi:hypothetical protein RUM43_014432 [Polyplax serrata]|uniref:Uncharacterized protein n=1 Tax=Polyplax serrata TaxID=468196 RepID=A0AAN8NIM6_POLSC
MEKSTKLGEEDGTENVTLREGKTVMEEPQKKKKLVFFEVDSCNNGQDGYEVPNFKIKEFLRTTSQGCNGGNASSSNGLTRGPEKLQSSPKSCQFPVVSGGVSRIMCDEFGIDLIELQNRILELEKQLKNENLGLPPIFSDLKSQVENFRNKLETAECCKRAELQKEPFSQRFQYRRTSSERGRKIRDKFLNIW